jgi:GNAT superfamily N-acetyltransferase
MIATDSSSSCEDEAMSNSSIIPSEPPSVTVRLIAPEDAMAVAELSGQLGYEASVETISERIARLSSCADRQVAFVACVRGEVVGWIEAAITHHLQSAPYSLISGLVVREGMRSLGVGKKLCAEVEVWSRKQDIATLRVTSRTSREDAHRFYLREGFQRIKTWAVFEKMLM